MNSAAVNIHVQVFVWTSVFNSFEYIPRVELLGHMVILCYWGTTKHFPQQLYHFTFLPAMCEGSTFSTSSTTPVIFCFFDYSPPSGCECYLTEVLICISLVLNYVEHHFICLLTAISISPSEKCLVESFTHIYLFIFGCVGSPLLRAGFSLVAVSGGYSSLRCTGFSLRWLLLLQSTGSRLAGFSSCGMWAQ